MFLPILFLFLNGVEAQETQKPEVNPSWPGIARKGGVG